MNLKPLNKHGLKIATTTLDHIDLLQRHKKITFFEESFNLDIAFLDTKGIIRGSNNQMAISFGYARASYIIGKTLSQLIENINGDPTIAPMIYEKEQQIIHTKKGLDLEEKGVLTDDKIHFFLTYKKPLIDSRGNAVGIIGVSTEITEYKK